jgi:hypothetical protein
MTDPGCDRERRWGQPAPPAPRPLSGGGDAANSELHLDGHWQCPALPWFTTMGFQRRHVPMSDRCALLREQWSDSCSRLGRQVAALTDAEFFWEPCAGCWTVHRRDETRAAKRRRVW